MAGSAQLDPALVAHRDIGDDLESELLRVELQTPILVPDRNCDLFDVWFHVFSVWGGFLPFWKDTTTRKTHHRALLGARFAQSVLLQSFECSSRP